MRLFRSLFCVAMLALPAVVLAQTQQPPPAQGEFVPLSEIPPEEQIPAFTLVAAAYAFVWAALMFYLWTIARRLRRVDDDLKALEGGPQ
jgi:CcmD family protein